MSTRSANSSPARRRRREPLKIDMTVVVRTGEEAEDEYILMEDRELRMAGSVFEYRDRIMRYFVGTLMRVAATSPSVYREIAPTLTSQLRGMLGRVRGRGPGQAGR